MWTKDEIREVIKVWNIDRPDQIAKRIGVSVSSVAAMASILRKSGIRLARKRRNGYLQNLIKEIKSELK